MQEYVLQIDFLDRPGLGYEIFQKMEITGVDKVAMEVIPPQAMMIKVRCASGNQVSTLIEDLKSVFGITAVTLGDQMPYEDREHQLNTILNSVREGILAVDKEGRITHINEFACKIFHCSPQQAIGLRMEELAENPPILDTLKTGQSYCLKERKFTRNGRVVHYFTSGVPVLNDKGQTIGAVATINDICQMADIVSKVDKSRRFKSFDDIVFQSKKMHELITSARTVARGSSTILLRGESGTGKELFASAIHMESPRYKEPFIAVNCAALPDTLLESELFGYEEGAFTGAVKGGRKGLVEQADGGTLFLDEIGEISSHVQVRLLRVLQEGTIRRVGGSREIPVNVRVIAATHRNLEDMLYSGSFREDLYYRLNVIPLTIPPLRERKEDIPLIAQYLIRKICTKLDKSEMKLTNESIQLLINHEWLGNVRELENVLERLINLIDGPEIRPDHLVAWGGLVSFHSKARNMLHAGDAIVVEIPDDGDWPELKEIVAQVEKEVITRVLQSNPSSRLAGQALGVSNTTILNKMKAYGIK